MSKPNDGGSAFPDKSKLDFFGHRIAQPGMTLRDWFASQSLIGMKLPLIGPAGSIRLAEAVSDEYAYAAYRFADAMLKAREGGK